MSAWPLFRIRTRYGLLLWRIVEWLIQTGFNLILGSISFLLSFVSKLEASNDWKNRLESQTPSKHKWLLILFSQYSNAAFKKYARSLTIRPIRRSRLAEQANANIITVLHIIYVRPIYKYIQYIYCISIYSIYAYSINMRVCIMYNE